MVLCGQESPRPWRSGGMLAARTPCATAGTGKLEAGVSGGTISGWVAAGTRGARNGTSAIVVVQDIFPIMWCGFPWVRWRMRRRVRRDQVLERYRMIRLARPHPKMEMSRVGSR